MRFPALHALPADASVADQLTWDLERADGWDRFWRYRKFSRLPDAFLRPVATHYRTLWEQKGERSANLFLLELSDRLAKLAIDPSTSDDDISGLAKRMAHRCRETLAHSKTHKQAASGLLRVCIRYGISPPTGLEAYVTTYENGANPVTYTGIAAPMPRPIVARLTDDAWWRRKLRVIHGRLLEAEAIRLRQVHRRAGRYVSDATYRRHQQQRRRNARALAALVAENEAGHTIPLEELVEKSLANPNNRRAELMVRIYGFDQVSQELGHAAVMLTITCPSRMHACGYKDGEPNPRFDGESTPRQSQKYLAKLWSRIRAKWQRQGLRPYGFRVTEAHHDGTPHWHLLLFIEHEHLAAMIATARHYALEDSPDEPGAEKHRFRIEHIDRSKGSATGYVAKYISKNIDGKGLPTEDGKEPPATLAHRMAAWSSTWGIRQFQQIGGAPVSLWRELRRAPELASSPTIIGALATAADSANWAEFLRLTGGPQAQRKALPIRLEKAEDKRVGRYGEALGLRIVGIALGNIVFSTRFHTWSINRKRDDQNCTRGQPPANSSTAIEKGETVIASPPWSSVNNCTQRSMNTRC